MVLCFLLGFNLFRNSEIALGMNTKSSETASSCDLCTTASEGVWKIGRQDSTVKDAPLDAFLVPIG